MNSQKLKTAIISYLSNSITEYPVVDSEADVDVVLPLIAVKIDSTERHSRAIFSAEVIEISIAVITHAGDEYSDVEFYDICDDVLALIKNPEVLKPALNTLLGETLHVDHIQFSGGSTDFDEQANTCTFNGTAVTQVPC